MEQTIAELLDKYLGNTLTDADRSDLAERLRMPETRAELELLIDAQFHNDNRGGLSAPGQGDAQFERLLRAITADAAETGTADLPRIRPRRLFLRRIAVAASILLVLGASGWFFFVHPRQEPPAIAAATIPPGTNRATLTLSNGNKIILDSAATGLLATQDNTTIHKAGSAALTYSPSATGAGPLVYNTLSTPRGGWYQLRLPDGTKVWLNAASSITYPVAFRGKERSVSINGEAYFAVAPNKSMPFIVHTPQSAAIVLGTEFNINAYADEKDIRTTLVSGAVKFNAGDSEKLLRPGQQTIFDPLTHALDVEETDVEQAIAWKNGRFEFEHSDLAAIMRQISRWYDMDISYETDKYDGARFGGGLSRNLNLSYTLRLLETGGVHYKIGAKKIIIIP
jgi:transmembrane sensor